jgi:hypothetical protein
MAPDSAIPTSDEPDYLGMLIERLLREGLVLYGQGHPRRAIDRWRTVLRLAPGHPKATEYLSIAGEPLPTETSIPERVTLRVRWLDGEEPEGVRQPNTQRLRAFHADAGTLMFSFQEIYEVLFDRAKRAVHAGSWELAAVLLETCVHRRVDDDRAWRLLSVVRDQMRTGNGRPRAA